MSWIKRLFGLEPPAQPPARRGRFAEADGSTSKLIAEIEERKCTERLAHEAGIVRGQFYVDLVPELNRLRSEKDDDAGLALLMEIIEASERTAAIERRPPPPGYTERASVIHRRRRLYEDEISLIDRYERLLHEYAEGDPYDSGAVTWDRLEKRRSKARELAAKR